MRHAIILAHPAADSFTASVAGAYEKAVVSLGHSAVVRDLYKLGFDPCLQADERPDTGTYREPEDVRRERDLLRDCNVFVLVYPIWFGTPPAMMKGYVERVFNEGFAFDSFRGGRAHPLLTDRRLISFTSSGSTRAWLEETGVWVSLRTIFDDYVAKVCGMSVADHVHFASVVPGLDERWVLENLRKVADVARAHFGGGAR